MNRIAILYQAIAPAIIDGAKKPLKKGGYADSGADIACQLDRSEIIIPVDHPNALHDLDWVFPDTHEGIETAIRKGAGTFWLNTVLFKGHPIEDFFTKNLSFIGQLPKQVGAYDDKYKTNKILAENGLRIPQSISIMKEQLSEPMVKINFPMVLKPNRGRGSQGVVVVNNEVELKKELKDLFARNEFGTKVYVEEFLPGKEITVTVMPQGRYVLQGKEQRFENPWSLPVIERFNHNKGVAPYSGRVAVIENSSPMSLEERNSDEIQAVCRQCEKAASLINIKAPIRIDCRKGENNKFYLFDLNLKPNMTGPSRAHRQNQDSLTLLAAREIGWTYSDLLSNIASQRWRLSSSGLIDHSPDF